MDENTFSAIVVVCSLAFAAWNAYLIVRFEE
jgi:hypothetical protein